jgi:small subunit ribosomal protein S6
MDRLSAWNLAGESIYYVFYDKADSQRIGIYKEVYILVGYEITYIIDPNLAEDAVPKVVERYSDYVTKAGGQVINIDTWGRRRLAFEIKGKNEGFYITMRYNSTTRASIELRRVIGIDEEILRSVIIRVN